MKEREMITAGTQVIRYLESISNDPRLRSLYRKCPNLEFFLQAGNWPEFVEGLILIRNQDRKFGAGGLSVGPSASDVAETILSNIRTVHKVGIQEENVLKTLLGFPLQ